MRCAPAFACFAAAIAIGSREARAYRPFDGTDADVAEVGEFELELGPTHFYGQRSRQYLIAPTIVANLGLVRNLELVAEARGFAGLEDVPKQARVRLLDDDVLLKWIVRRGVLQGERGVSIALEGGPLLPELEGDGRFGAQLDTIVSYR